MFAISWCTAALNTINRKLKDVHFSVIIFTHSLAAIFVSGVWMLIEAFACSRMPLDYSA